MPAVPKAVRALQFRPGKTGNKFSSQNRLLRRDGFNGALKGRRISGSGFNAFMQPNNSGQARLGIIVSKRDFPLAVSRNRIKRMAREAFRCHPLKTKAVDLVLMARRHGAPNRADIESLLGRVDSACGIS
jgi:ribonuclease P protein component